MYINLPRVHRIARDIARLITGISGVTVPMPEKMRIIHGVYGGAYGRPLAAGTNSAAIGANE